MLLKREDTRETKFVASKNILRSNYQNFVIKHIVYNANVNNNKNYLGD